LVRWRRTARGRSVAGSLPRMVAKYNFFLSRGQLATRILRVSSPPFDWMNANPVLMYATEK
jgi:hypothetical protein